MTQPPTEYDAQAPGVRITACSRGGHLMTWTTEGVERLWMSPLSACGGAEAIRGGVPVLFPQFSIFGSLPKHGLLRTADCEPGGKRRCAVVQGMWLQLVLAECDHREAGCAGADPTHARPVRRTRRRGLTEHHDVGL